VSYCALTSLTTTWTRTILFHSSPQCAVQIISMLNPVHCSISIYLPAVFPFALFLRHRSCQTPAKLHDRNVSLLFYFFTRRSVLQPQSRNIVQHCVLCYVGCDLAGSSCQLFVYNTNATQSFGPKDISRLYISKAVCRLGGSPLYIPLKCACTRRQLSRCCLNKPTPLCMTDLLHG